MSERLKKRWQMLADDGRKALIPYITPEYPVRDVTVPLLRGLDDAGADLIEVGLPYSDPLADGPTIQLSSDVALKNGATLSRILEAVRAFRTDRETPVVLMGYVNPILRMGVDVFVRQAVSAGVDGVIVPDLPPEEAADLLESARRHQLAVVFLVAPTTTDERLRHVDAMTRDFLYCVSVTGVTGARSTLGLQDGLEAFLQRVRANVRNRFVVGFGISTADQVAAVWKHADGAVVGSALIRSMASATGPQEAVANAVAFFRGLRPREASHE
ncbi:MAG: tryptophan synthase subunit alpha [Bacteroidetes bacterium]|jgi:tryptophan synthase alpha chain|nr:tryptophan synthase subunit alpha [Bacteroidota bacterium]